MPYHSNSCTSHFASSIISKLNEYRFQKFITNVILHRLFGGGYFAPMILTGKSEMRNQITITNYGLGITKYSITKQRNLFPLNSSVLYPAGRAFSSNKTAFLASVLRFFRQIKSFILSVKSFYRQIKPFTLAVKSFYRQIKPFTLAVKSFYRQIKPFILAVKSFYSQIKPFILAVKSFYSGLLADISYHYQCI
jgi:hypothetical protein